MLGSLMLNWCHQRKGISTVFLPKLGPPSYGCFHLLKLVETNKEMSSWHSKLLQVHVLVFGSLNSSSFSIASIGKGLNVTSSVLPATNNGLAITSVSIICIHYYIFNIWKATPLSDTFTSHPTMIYPITSSQCIPTAGGLKLIALVKGKDVSGQLYLEKPPTTLGGVSRIRVKKICRHITANLR